MTIAKNNSNVLLDDPLGNLNTHIGLVRAYAVYGDTTGAGVEIAIIDDGVAADHPDLASAYDGSRDLDVLTGDDDAGPRFDDDNHGTAVAGIAAARGDNGEGGFGVAWNATITGIRLPFSELDNDTVEDEPSFYAAAFARAGEFDIANNSWGNNQGLYNVLTGDFASIFTPMRNAVANGRDGLGTVFMFAAGNERTFSEGQLDTNYSNLTNLHEVIAIAATDLSGKIASYSTPGATVFVAAPAATFSTDRVGPEGDNAGDGEDLADPDYTNEFSGTSAATPVTSGVVALMLEAEPGLGYRDVKEILAYSARSTGSSKAYVRNGAENWNGGGLHVSHDYGFGLVDAQAAVGLAQTWFVTGGEAHTENNLELQTVIGVRDGNGSIDDQSVVEFDFAVSAGALDAVDEIELDLDFTHASPGDLRITLVSPAGTESVLVDRPGGQRDTPTGPEVIEVDFADGFRFGSSQHWGESPSGTWTLRIEDLLPGNGGFADSAVLYLYGRSPEADDRYVFTDDYARYRQVDGPLTDSGGNDVFNLAGMTAKNTVSLVAGSSSKIAGKTFLLGEETSIEVVIGGEGADTLTGNDLANLISGRGGKDRLFGGGGGDEIDGGADADLIDGGDGTDTLILAGARADFVFSTGKKDVTVTDTVGDGGLDNLVGIELVRFADQTVSLESLLASI